MCARDAVGLVPRRYRSTTELLSDDNGMHTQTCTLHTARVYSADRVTLPSSHHHQGAPHSPGRHGKCNRCGTSVCDGKKGRSRRAASRTSKLSPVTPALSTPSRPKALAAALASRDDSDDEAGLFNADLGYCLMTMGAPHLAGGPNNTCKRCGERLHRLGRGRPSKTRTRAHLAVVDRLAVSDAKAITKLRGAKDAERRAKYTVVSPLSAMLRTGSRFGDAKRERGWDSSPKQVERNRFKRAFKRSWRVASPTKGFSKSLPLVLGKSECSKIMTEPVMQALRKKPLKSVIKHLSTIKTLLSDPRPVSSRSFRRKPRPPKSMTSSKSTGALTIARKKPVLLMSTHFRSGAFSCKFRGSSSRSGTRPRNRVLGSGKHKSARRRPNSAKPSPNA